MPHTILHVLLVPGAGYDLSIKRNDRAHYLELFKLANVIIFSGGTKVKNHGTEASLMYDDLMKKKQKNAPSESYNPHAAFIVEEKSLDTYTNMIYSLKLLEAKLIALPNAVSEIIITFATDVHQNRRFRLSMERIIAHEWNGPKITLAYVDLFRRPGLKVAVIETLFWLVHFFDRRGRSPLAKVNRFRRSRSIL